MQRQPDNESLMHKTKLSDDFFSSLSENLRQTAKNHQGERKSKDNNMNRTRLMLCAAALSVVFQFAASAAEPEAKAAEVIVNVTTDRQDALYKCGEKVTFNCTVTKNGQPLTAGKATLKLSNDGLKTLSSREIDLAQSNPFHAEGTLAAPGFLQCMVTADKINGLGGAGFEPEKIQPETKLPEDFNKFWDAGVRELDKIPPDVQLEPLPKFSTPQFDCFKISFANLDNTRIYGFLSVPKNGKGPFPALVNVPGAGPGFYSPDSDWVKRGAIVLRMNVHQYNPPTDKQAISTIHEAINKPLRYCYHGAPDRNKYYFRNAILGVSRAINYLAARPDVDKRRIVMQGGSQGGAFALIMAGLNKNITATIAAVPALCDHAGFQADRSAGWPQLVRTVPGSLEMSAYFDAVNFARNITCPAVVTVGFIDRTCSPSSVYAAYNTIPVRKTIINRPAMSHSQDKESSTFINECLKNQLGL